MLSIRGRCIGFTFINFGLKHCITRMSSVDSYLDLTTQMSPKFCHPAAERNKQPILDKLLLHLTQAGCLLEVSSGSGQHVAHIAPHFPNVTFQPTEYDETSLPSIAEYVKDLPNAKSPVKLDVRAPVESWLGGGVSPGSFRYVLNINMIHISEWACTLGLFKGSSYLLQPGGLLITYGPYAFNGAITPESNVRFNESLKQNNPSWGLRDVHTELEPLAALHKFRLTSMYALPANNHLLVWTKE